MKNTPSYLPTDLTEKFYTQSFYDKLNLNEWIVQNRPSTFIVKVHGIQCSAQVFSNDILVIDKSITAKHRDLAVVVYNYEFTVRRIIIENKHIYLEATNPYHLSIVD